MQKLGLWVNGDNIHVSCNPKKKKNYVLWLQVFVCEIM